MPDNDWACCLETFAACAGMQKLDAFLTANGKAEGGDFFLGARYSYAEVLASPFLGRAAVILPHLKQYSPLEAAQSLGLDRLHRWYQVRQPFAVACWLRTPVTQLPAEVT